MLIRGYILDSQPNQPRPKLDLYFDKKHRPVIPSGEREPIVLDLNGVRWHALLNSTNPTNAPYVLTWLARDDGIKRACTDVFLELGLAEKAEVKFEQDGNDFRLAQITNRGTWRPGGAPHERIAGTGTKVRSVSPAPPAQGTPPRNTTTSFPFDDRNEILRLADHLYWNLITLTEASEERAFEQEMPIARKEGFLTKSLFVRLGRWKSVRQTPSYESNDEATIRDATARAFAATDERNAISALTALRGVALRTATAVLHWMRPDLYPILDVRVVAALGKPQPRYEDVDFYLEIAKEVRSLAQRHGLDLRTIDRALWAWQKSQSYRRDTSKLLSPTPTR